VNLHIKESEVTEMGRIGLIRIGAECLLCASTGLREEEVIPFADLLEELDVEDEIYQFFDPCRGSLVVRIEGIMLTDLFNLNGRRSYIKIQKDPAENVIVVSVAIYAKRIHPRKSPRGKIAQHNEIPHLFIRTFGAYVMMWIH